LRILGIEIVATTLKFRFSIAHASNTRKSDKVFFLILTSKDGLKGYGECHARPYVTGETEEQVCACLTECIPLLTNADFENPQKLISEIRAAIQFKSGGLGAMCAIDLAVHDLASQSIKIPISELLDRSSSKANSTNTQMTAVYPLTKSGLMLCALNLVYRTYFRFTDIKVKGTGNLEIDREYIRAIRSKSTEPLDIRIDLNESLPIAEAERYFSEMSKRPTNISWFEQPFTKGDLASAARYQKQFSSKITLCADESLCTMEDLDRIIESNAFKAINIRIAKNGGLIQSLELAQRAEAAGIQSQLGCLVGETSLLSYAALHLAAAFPKFRYHEGCFARYLLKCDPARPSLGFSRGAIIKSSTLPPFGLAPVVRYDKLLEMNESPTTQ